MNSPGSRSPVNNNTVLKSPQECTQNIRSRAIPSNVTTPNTTTSNIIQPIPTKPSSLTSYSYDLNPIECPLLEDIVSDCFLHAIDQLNDKTKTDVVCKFEAFLTRLHCLENITFLVDIYKYECFYERIFPVVERLKKPCGRTSSDADKKMDRVIVEVSDISRATPIRNNHCCAMSFDSSNLSDEEILDLQWKYIIQNYILTDSPLEINLSQKLVNEIIQENLLARAHYPCILRRASKEVLQLLQENVYYNFKNSELYTNNSHEKVHTYNGHEKVHTNNGHEKVQPNNGHEKARTPRSENKGVNTEGAQEVGASQNKSLQKSNSMKVPKASQPSLSKSQSLRAPNGRHTPKQKRPTSRSSTPTKDKQDSSSLSPSISSLTTLLGHWKLYGYHTSTPSPPLSSPLVTSLNGSPVIIEKEEDEESIRREEDARKEENALSLKFWGKRKH